MLNKINTKHQKVSKRQKEESHDRDLNTFFSKGGDYQK